MIAMGTAAIAGPVLGGLIGQQTSAANRAAAQQAAQQAYDEINRLGAPPDQSAAIILKHFQQAGLYTPGMEQQISAGISKASETQTNTAGRQAQVGALGQMKEASETGYTAEDRAALNHILQQTGAAEQGRLGAIQQGMQSRGLAGGGADLAAQLSAASSASNQAANQSDQLAAQAQQARMGALGQYAGLGGQLSASDFAQAQAKAQAADRFKQFDVQNSLAQQQRNVAAQNQGQLYNTSEAQRLSDTNTQQDNAEKMRQVAAQRQYWQDQAQLAGMKANARMGQSANYQSQADATAKSAQTIGSGIGAAGGAGMNYLSRQPKTPNTTTASNNSPGVGDYESNQQDATGGMTEQGGNYQAAAQGGIMGQDSHVHHGYENSPLASLLNKGGNVPGKAKVKGDSLKNDTVKTKLSPGEIVIPRTVAELGPAAAYGFVHATTKHKDE